MGSCMAARPAGLPASQPTKLAWTAGVRQLCDALASTKRVISKIEILPPSQIQVLLGVFPFSFALNKSLTSRKMVMSNSHACTAPRSS